MRLEQALSSGRRVRRVSQRSRPWYTVEELSYLALTDALADDWEIEETLYIVTKEDLLTVYELGRNLSDRDLHGNLCITSNFQSGKCLNDLIAKFKVYHEG